MQERQIKCPQCGRLTVYSVKNTSRPFCSERCKLIDLGEWASESYKVPVPSSEQQLNPDEFSGENDSYFPSDDE